MNRLESLVRKGLLAVPSQQQPKRRAARPPIAVCIPFEEIVYAKWVTDCFMPLCSDLTERDIVSTTSGSFIDTARRVLAEQALTSECEYLFWVDSDNIAVGGLAVAERLLSHGKDIVGGWYSTKKMPLRPCVYDDAGYDAVKDWHNYRQREDAPSDETAPRCHCGKRHAQYIEKVDGLGFGCMLIHRRVFEAIKEQWFSTKQGTEDLHFLRLAKAQGFDCYVDWGVHSPHLGIVAY